MPQSSRGIPVTPLQRASWIKSSYSNPSGDCVELTKLTGEKIAVRNSRYPGGPTLLYTRLVMVAFLKVVKEGGFDGMTRLSLCPGSEREPAANIAPANIAPSKGRPFVVHRLWGEW
jgi:Domain of unknown function (DUF397)